jgi:hypothetical protein
MSRIWTRIFAGVTIVEGNTVEIDNYLEPDRNDVDMLALAALQTNVFAGGSELVGLDASATGDVKLLEWQPLYFDNASAQWTGTAATLVAQYRYRIRVSNAAITFTPKIWYASTEAGLISAPIAATISGEAACSATDADYSGANQLQTVAFTIPTGAKYWAAGGTIAGSVAAGYQVWARALRDIYVSTAP